jgi:hypothetical protein
MKKSMQVIAIVAFLGCWTIMVIAAGKDKSHYPEKCGSEWRKGLHLDREKNNSAGFMENKTEEPVCTNDQQQELLLPAQLFHALL